MARTWYVTPACVGVAAGYFPRSILVGLIQQADALIWNQWLGETIRVETEKECSSPKSDAFAKKISPVNRM
jgi:hypothetical protein